MRWRHEWKHEISLADALVIRQRMGVVGTLDPHAQGGCYAIRSLYFDNARDKALREKLDGVDRRDKWRIRMYDSDEDSFLERTYGTETGDLYKPDSMSFGGGRGNGREFDMDEFLAEREAEQEAQQETEQGSEQTAEQDAQQGSEQTGSQGENGQDTSGATRESWPDFGSMPEAGSASDSGGSDSGSEQTERPTPPSGGFDGQTPGDFDGQMPSDFGGQMPGGFGGGMGGFGGMGNSDVKLQYIDDNPSSYESIFSNAKTDVTSADKKRLINSLRKLSAGEDLENVLDTDEVLRYFVVHDYVCNGDSYTGTMVHNYYLHESDGKLSMIPWDYNLAFGGFAGGDATAQVNAPINDPTASGFGFGNFTRVSGNEDEEDTSSDETEAPATDSSSQAPEDESSEADSGTEGMPQMPGGGEMPQMPEGMEPPSGSGMPQMPSDGSEGGSQASDGGIEGVPQMPEGMQPPSGNGMPQMPEGMEPPSGDSASQMPGSGSEGGSQAPDSSEMPSTPNEQGMSFSGFGGFSSETDSRPMVDWIFSDEQYTQAYHELYQQFLDEVDVQSIIDQTEELIAPYVERDPTKFCTYEQFQTGVDTLRSFCQLRSQSVQGQLDGTIPSTEDGQQEDSSTLVDASAIELSDMGSMGNGGGQPGGERQRPDGRQGDGSRQGDLNGQQGGNQQPDGSGQQGDSDRQPGGASQQSDGSGQQPDSNEQQGGAGQQPDSDGRPGSGDQQSDSDGQPGSGNQWPGGGGQWPGGQPDGSGQWPGGGGQQPDGQPGGGGQWPDGQSDVFSG